MSIVVKEWQPAEGCKSCKDARRIMNDQTRISSHSNTLAIKKIRAQEDRINELEQQLERAQKKLAEAKAKLETKEKYIPIGVFSASFSDFLKNTREGITLYIAPASNKSELD